MRKVRSNNEESEAQVMRVIGVAACGNFNCQRETFGRSLSFALPAARLLRPGARRDALLMTLPAAMFVDETLFFILRVIPFYRRAS